MNGIVYEHHSSIHFINELCPFKIKLIKEAKNIGANWHTNPEIIYIAKGEGKVICASEAIGAKKGDIFIIPPETIHQIIQVNSLEYYFIITDLKFWTDNGLNPDDYYFEKRISDSKTETLINDAISARERLYTDNSDISRAILRNTILTLIIDICKNHAVKAEDDRKAKIKNSDSYVKSAMQYINKNFNRPLTTVEIAESVGISQSYLSREFKRCTGETVVNYINILRCKRASQLIMQGYSVTNAALECGFESGSYFSQIYKKTTGQSPSDIKNKNGNINVSGINAYFDDGYINS